MTQDHQTKGLTLIESLVAVGVLSFFVLIFGASYMYVTTNTLIRQRTLAYNLAEEEIEAIRNLTFTDIDNVSDIPFIEVQYNQGLWLVDNPSSPPSGPNALSHVSVTSGENAQIIAPGYQHTDSTIEVEMYIPSVSPAGWQDGVLLRYGDSQNFYHVYFTADTLTIAKTVDGTPSVLGQTSKVMSTDTWYSIKVTVVANVISLYIDDVLELSATDPASSLAKGRTGFSSSQGSHLYLDDVTITDTSILTWNFDSDVAGFSAHGWRRLGINDLPLGTTHLTITDDQVGYSDVKKVTASVQWEYKQQTRSIEMTTLISR